MKQELRRQFIHFLAGSLFISLTVLLGVQATLYVLLTVFAVGFFASMLLRDRGLGFLGGILKGLERPHEKKLPGKGALMFFLGAIVLMLLFKSQAVVVGALCVAVYGDAASTVFGMRFGKHRSFGKKTWEGTLAGMAVSTIFLLAFLPVPVAVAAAVVGMLAELLPFDDSFTIPVAAAIALAVLL